MPSRTRWRRWASRSASSTCRPPASSSWWERCRHEGAEVRVPRPPHRRRGGGAEDFFDGHFTTPMADDDLLVEVRVPVTPPGAGWAFYEIARRHGDFALVGAAAMVAKNGAGVGEARIALIGMADRATRCSA